MSQQTELELKRKKRLAPLSPEMAAWILWEQQEAERSERDRRRQWDERAFRLRNGEKPADTPEYPHDRIPKEALRYWKDLGIHDPALWPEKPIPEEPEG